MIHKNEKNRLEYFSSEILGAHKAISHGFFTRNGGVSSIEEFRSLNCNIRAEEDIENVKQNRLIIKNELYADSIRFVDQVHSNKVVTLLTDVDPESIEADAIITNVPKLAVGVKTADCVPILFFDPKANIVGAAHAGWRGALNGIIENTVRAIKELGGVDLHAVIGPCIQQDYYEVGDDFFDNFKNANKEYEKFFITKNNRKHFNLPGFVEKRLYDSGISKIENLSIDTFSNEESLFSYRRNFLKNQTRYGAQLSAIVLNGN